MELNGIDYECTGNFTLSTKKEKQNTDYSKSFPNDAFVSLLQSDIHEYSGLCRRSGAYCKQYRES